MIANELYNRLENDFVKEGMWDEWAQWMGELEDYLSPSFTERSMGLVCDFTDRITKVYTAVFPSESVMEKILAEGITDAMLFVHHAAIWDIRIPAVFYNMDGNLLEKLKINRISIFNYHVPLDNFSEYATTKTLADALGLDIEKPFGEYCGAMAGVIGRTPCKTVEELNALFSKAVGHQTKLYSYGDSFIQDGLVAVCAGGGNDVEIVTELFDYGVRVHITGVTALNEYSAPVHAYEREKRINVLGGTHYSTEKFACIAMCKYFDKLGLPSVFIEDTPIFEDM